MEVLVAVVVAAEALAVVVALAVIAEVVVADEVVSTIVDVGDTVGEDEEEVHARGVLPLMRARKRPFS
jgi:hypothetical protein